MKQILREAGLLDAVMNASADSNLSVLKVSLSLRNNDPYILF